MTNPFTGEVLITLKDGIERKLKFDYDALIRFEELAGEAWSEAVAKTMSATHLRYWVFVGCMRDAVERKEKWTLEKVSGELLEVAAFVDTTATVIKALGLVVARGEAKPAAVASSPAPAEPASPSPGS